MANNGIVPRGSSVECVLLLVVVLAAADLAVAAVPTITSVMPKTGSLLGGTRLTMTGTDLMSSGASSGVAVYVGQAATNQWVICDRIAHYSSSKQLVCDTQATDLRGDVAALIVVDGVQADCLAADGCTFKFTADATPVVASVRPEVVVAAPQATITVAGSNLHGDSQRSFSVDRDFNVFIGDGQRCALPNPTDLTDDGFPCTIDASVSAGSADVSVTLSQLGKAAAVVAVGDGAAAAAAAVPQQSLALIILPSVTRVDPLTGSTNGGQTISVFGSGFSTVPKENEVAVHGVGCAVVKVEQDHLICVTSPHSETEATSAASPLLIFPSTVTVDYYANLEAGATVQDSLLARAFYYQQPTGSAAATKTAASFGGDIPFVIVDPNAALRFTTHFVAPQNGYYIFELFAGSVGELWLSNSSFPVKYEEQMVAKEQVDVSTTTSSLLTTPSWAPIFHRNRIAFHVSPRSGFGQEKTQTSPRIYLQQGQSYWMRAFLKRNNGQGIAFSVRVTLPDGSNVTNPTGSLIQTEEATSAAPSSVVGAHPLSTVVVKVKGITAICDGACLSRAAAFQYTSASTPRVDTVTPTTVAAGTAITISGSGFAPNVDVTASGAGQVSVASCAVTSVTGSSIVCLFQQPLSGPSLLRVNVRPVGDASCTAIVTGAITVTAVSPSSGSIAGGTLITFTGTGFGSDATALSASIGGSPCAPIVSAAPTSVVCRTTAHADGAATATVTYLRGISTSIFNDAVAFQGNYLRPGAPKASPTRVSPKKGGVTGGTLLEIWLSSTVLTAPLTATTDVSVALIGIVDTTSIANCVVQLAMVNRIVCRTEYHRPEKVTVRVTLAGPPPSAPLDVGTFEFVQRVTSVNAGAFSTTYGGNYVELGVELFGRPKLHELQLTVGGTPCSSLRMPSSTMLQCYVSSGKTTQPLPTLFTGTVAADHLMLDFETSPTGAITVATVGSQQAFRVPTGSYLMTRRRFATPFVITANVLPTQSNKCVYMRAFPADVASQWTGYVGFAGRGGQGSNLGAGSRGSSGWAPDGPDQFTAPRTANVGLDTTAFREWKMEVRDSGVSFFIDNVFVGSQDAAAGVAAMEGGSVGFGFSCQDIYVKDFTVRALSPMAVQLTYQNTVISTHGFDVRYNEYPTLSVVSISKTVVKGGDRVSFTMSSIESVWRFTAVANSVVVSSSPVDWSRFPNFCGSGFVNVEDIFNSPDKNGYPVYTKDIQCTVDANLPAGSYNVYLRDNYSGFLANVFTVQVVPTIDLVSPSDVSPATGAILTITGRNFPNLMGPSSGSTPPMMFTIGGTSCSPIEMVANRALCVIPAASLTPAKQVSVSATFDSTTVLCVPASATSSANCQVNASIDTPPSMSSVAPTTVTRMSQDITITGAGFVSSSNIVRVTVGPYGCAVQWADATRIVCRLSDIMPVAGTYSIAAWTVNGGVAASAGPLTVSIAFDTSSVAAGTIICHTGGDADVRLEGFYDTAFGSMTTIFSEDYSVPATTTTTLTGPFVPVIHNRCPWPLGRVLGTFDRDTALTKVFNTGLITTTTHATLWIRIVAAVVDASSVTSFNVIVDGVTHPVTGVASCGLLSSCGRSDTRDCMVTVALNVPHTASLAAVVVKAPTVYDWSLSSITIGVTDAASPYSASVLTDGGSFPLTFVSGTSTVLRFATPVGDSTWITTTTLVPAVTAFKSGNPISCDNCVLESRATACPTATAFAVVPTVASPVHGVHWISSGPNVEQHSRSSSSPSAPTSLIRVGGSATWSEGAHSAETFSPATFAAVTFRFSPPMATNCHMMFGLGSGRASAFDYSAIDFAIYYDNGNIAVYEEGTYVAGGPPLSRAAAPSSYFSIRCASPTCDVMEYAADDRVFYRSRRTVTFDVLHLSASLYETGCEITDINVVMPPNAPTPTTASVVVAYAAVQDALPLSAVEMDSVNCPVVLQSAGLVVVTCATAPSATTLNIYLASSAGKATASVNAQPLLRSLSRATGSTNGGQRLQIKGAGLSAVGLDFSPICASGTVSITDSELNCLTIAAADGATITTFSPSTGMLSCWGASPSSSCLQYQWKTTSTPSLTGISVQQAGLNVNFVVTGAGFDSSSLIRLSSSLSCVPSTAVTATQFACTLTAPPAGVYTGAYVTSLGGATGTQSVTIPFVVSSFSPSTLGTLGDGRLVLIGSGLHGASPTLTAADSTPLCASITVSSTGNRLTCITSAFSPIPAGPYTLTVNGVASTLSASLTISASVNPTLTGVFPTGPVAGGDTIRFTGTQLENGAVIAVGSGNVPCEGVVAAADGQSATCFVNGVLTSGSAHAVSVRTRAGLGTAGGVSVTARFAVFALFSSTPTATGLDLVVQASGLVTSTAYGAVVGKQYPCTVTAVTTTTISCSATAPSTFIPTRFGISVWEPATTSATVAYTYSASLSPTITTIVPSSGSAGGGASVTITGTNFNIDSQQNDVTIGNARCLVQSVSDARDSLVCVTEANAPNAAAVVNVMVLPIGSATGTVTYNYQLEITSLALENAAAQASVEGGLPLAINGIGFQDVTSLTVTVGYAACRPTSITPTVITCLLPAAVRPNPNANVFFSRQPLQPDYTLRADTTSVVRVSVNGILATIDDATLSIAYAQSATPRITAVSQDEQTASVPTYAGDIITITGTGFAATGNEVTLVHVATGGTSTCGVQTESTTSVTCVASPTKFGRSRVAVRVPGSGLAYTGRTCPTGTFLMCDGQCLTDADCRRAAWGRYGCQDIVDYIYDETFCHANGGSDRVNSPLRLDNGKVFNVNCPLYHCEGGDCNMTLNYAQRTSRISTCGVDPNGVVLDVHPEITGIAGARNSSVLGGQEYVLSGRGFSSDVRILLGAVPCVVQSATNTEVTCRTVASGADAVNVTLTLTRDGAPATCNTDCTGFGFLTALVPMVTAVAYDRTTSAQRVTVSGSALGTNAVVTVGGAVCGAETTTDTLVTCHAPNLATTAANTVFPITVRVPDVGYAYIPAASTSIQYKPVVFNVGLPVVSGSTLAGTTVSVTGFGFPTSTSTVIATFGGCSTGVISVTTSLVVVKTISPCAAGAKTASVKSYGTSSVCAAGAGQSCTFTYATGSTPTFTTVTGATAGSAMAISGGNLLATNGAADITITVGNESCPVTSFTAPGTVTCTVPSDNDAGALSVNVHVANAAGFASGPATTVSYAATVTSFSPTSGSLAGGQLVTIVGTGFPTDATAVYALVASVPCRVTSSTHTAIICVTGASAAAVDVVSVSYWATGPLTTVASYTYSSAMTPTVSSITPSRGSTAGGTRLTITGTGLSVSKTVTISGVECTQSGAEQTLTTAAAGSALYCTTGPHASQLTAGEVVVTESNQGNAAITPTAFYQYVDLWSRRTTWSGYPPPIAGGSVVIGPGETVMLDYSPPKLILIIVQGHLIFDDTVDITLECQYIVVNSGRFTIGTPEKPYAKRAIIRLFGDWLTPEIPLAGAKSVVVAQNGTLDWHGIPRTTWTHVAATATAGSTSLVLQGTLDWAVGERIVVGPTDFYFLHAEERTITAAATSTSVGGLPITTVTFTEPLRWDHFGERQCWTAVTPSDKCIDEIAEVILLSRNILVTGDDTTDLSGFGATTIFMRPLNHVRIGYVEFTRVGQKFQLGRYPVHFHLPGDCPTSWIVGNSVHHSHNRAFTIHGVNNVTYQKNVVYDTFGHSFFWEDGSERHNTVEDNVVFVTRVCTSCLNSDTTPANYWLTNPRNYLRRNVAGGGQFYGFWMSPMVPFATGPSGSTSICPQFEPLGAFEDNTAHSQGNYGLQFKPDWFPKTANCDGGSADAPAVMKNFFSYKNQIHGINFFTAGAVSFSNLTIADIGTTDIESSLLWTEHVDAANFTFGVNGGLFVAFSANQPYHRSDVRRGINMPLSDNFFAHDITFVNFVNENWALEPFRRQQRMSLDYPWGWEYVTRGLTFINSAQRLRYRFQHHAVINDMDGSLAGPTPTTGVAGTQIVPATPFFDRTKCQAVGGFTSIVELLRCAGDYKIRRLGNAASERGGDQNWTIQGVSEIVYRLKGMYVVTVPIGNEAFMEWMEAEGPNNYYNLFQSRYMRSTERMLFRIHHKEDRWYINGTVDGVQLPEKSEVPSLADASSGWNFTHSTNVISLMVARPNTWWATQAFRCPPMGCLAPGAPPPLDRECQPFALATSWYSGVVPTYDVHVTYNDSICLDNSTGTWPNYYLGSLLIEGRLQFKNAFCPPGGANNTVRIYVDRWVHIRGGEFLIGNETSAISDCRVEIIIAAVDYDNLTDVRSKSRGPWGSRAFAVEYGSLGMHGARSTTPVARLSAIAAVGATTLKLDTAVDGEWAVGDVVAIAHTRRNTMFMPASERREETEKRNVTAISADRKQITIDVPLLYSHHGEAPQVIDGRTFNIGAEVVRLTRRITVHGDHNPNVITAPIPWNAGWQLAIGCTPFIKEGCAGGTTDAASVFPMSASRPGVIHLDSVEFRDVGQKGKRSGGIEFDGLRGAPGNRSYMVHCSVHRALAVGVSLRDTSDSVALENNVVYDFQGDGIRVASKSNNLTANVVMLQRIPTSFCGEVYQPHNVECWIAMYRISQGNTLIGNVAVSGGGIGYMTEGTACSSSATTTSSSDSASSYWQNNVVHATRDGLMVLDNPALADYRWPTNNFACRKVGGVIAFSVADNGVAIWFATGNLQVANVVAVDNAVGMSSILMQRGATDASGTEELSLQLSQSIFAGYWNGQNCTAHKFMCRMTKVDDRPWCESFQDKKPFVGNMGLLETIFVTADVGETLGEKYFMWQEGDAYATIKAKATYTDLYFTNFNGANNCGTKTLAFYQNPYHNDTFHQHIFTRVRWGPNVLNGGDLYAKTTYGAIPGHLTDSGVLTPEQTYFLDFDNTVHGAFWPDAPNKMWIVDADGSFTKTGTRTHILSSQTLTRNSSFDSIGKFNGLRGGKTVSDIGTVRPSCQFQPMTNVFFCQDRMEFLTLNFESTAADALTRRVAPVVLCKGDGMVNWLNEPLCQEGVVDFAAGPLSHSGGHRSLQLRLSRWRFVVENKGNYTVHYRGTPPAASRWWLTNYEYAAPAKLAKDFGIVINTRIYGANSHSRVVIAVDGRRERPMFGFGYPYEYGFEWPKPLDVAGTHYHDKYITPTLHRNVFSFTMRPVVTIDLSHEPIIQLTMTVAITMQEFWSRQDMFAIALASALNIPPETLKFVQIVAGSDRRQAVASTTTATAEIDGGSVALTQSSSDRIIARARALSADKTALNQVFNATVLYFEAAYLAIEAVEPPINVAYGTPYVLFNVSYANSITTSELKQQINQAFIITVVNKGNHTLHRAATTSDVLLGNVYQSQNDTVANVAKSRFTVSYNFDNATANAFAMSDLLSLLASASTLTAAATAVQMPAAYRLEKWTYYRNDRPKPAAVSPPPSAQPKSNGTSVDTNNVTSPIPPTSGGANGDGSTGAVKNQTSGFGDIRLNFDSIVIAVAVTAAVAVIVVALAVFGIVRAILYVRHQRQTKSHVTAAAEGGGDPKGSPHKLQKDAAGGDGPKRRGGGTCYIDDHGDVDVNAPQQPHDDDVHTHLQHDDNVTSFGSSRNKSPTPFGASDVAEKEFDNLRTMNSTSSNFLRRHRPSDAVASSVVVVIHDRPEAPFDIPRHEPMMEDVRDVGRSYCPKPSSSSALSSRSVAVSDEEEPSAAEMASAQNRSRRRSSAVFALPHATFGFNDVIADGHAGGDGSSPRVISTTEVVEGVGDDQMSPRMSMESISPSGTRRRRSLANLIVAPSTVDADPESMGRSEPLEFSAPKA